MSSFPQSSSSSSSSSSFPCRIILLLDLDCFYAACERVRLQLPHETTALALLQWNSVLAVSYPARTQFRIKRGDSWEQVNQKSKNQCLALHLPLLSVSKPKHLADGTNNNSENDVSSSSITVPSTTTPATSSSSATADESTEQAYEREYQLTDEQRQHIVDHELHVRRYSHEGKACLERYRIASSRIFGVVVDTLQEKLGEGNFVLERASIDELFLDVTRYCWQEASSKNGDGAVKDVMAQTVLVGEADPSSSEQAHQSYDTDDNDDEDDPAILQALHQGCRVAHTIRQAVFDTLGFTLSAGISTTKLLAKLGATYGKPNGQALIRPSSIHHVMSTTPISNVRHLGGKIGKRVEALLPVKEPRTMSSIARCLSLPTLVEKLGQDTGRMVFDACRGMDREVVKHTMGALVKSITAFKSFPKTTMSSGEMDEWLRLLATEIVSRVRLDSHRNERYPKTCTIQYALSEGGGRNDRRWQNNKSLRIPFPTEHPTKKGGSGEDNSSIVTKLVHKAKDVIVAKEGQVTLIRVGFCASDFYPLVRSGGITSYFSERKDEAGSINSKTDDGSNEKNDSHSNVRQIDQKKPGTASLSSFRSSSPVVAVDKDLELARKLQKSYDREDALLTAAEKRAGGGASRASSKKARIDSFFTKRK